MHHPSAGIIEALLKEYKLEDYNYFITDLNGTTLKNDYCEKTHLGYKWLEPFALPMILMKETEKGSINEDSLLSRYISVRNIQGDLRLRDLVRIPESRPDLFPPYSDDVLSYLRNIIRQRFQDQHQQFYEKELNIKDNYSWNTQNLLTATQHISSYFDKENITGYLPLGEDIRDLYPTWYVENMYQLAGWYIFRINKHVVLWNSVSDDKHYILCMKLIDLQRTIAVICPYNADLSTFDSNGNPDLLLSPLALAILKKEFESDTCKIDYKETKEILCSQLMKKKNSPYLSLYIKELQTRIRYAEKAGKREDELRLKDVYRTLFAHSLPSGFISRSPLAAINYVSDRMSASRHFTLDKETAVTVFSSNQRRTYLAKNKQENDSVIFADKCWIENEQTKEIVWSPAISSELPVQIIKVERCDTVLPSGNYLLRYESDRNHSFESWLSPSPLIDDYGIRIYKK